MNPRAVLGSLLLSLATLPAAEIHVSPAGNDEHPGTAKTPLATFAAAQRVARASSPREPVAVVLHGGVYRLPQTLVFTPADNGTEYRTAPGETVVLSGGMKLELRWEPFRDGIFQAKTPAGLALDQLFVNGKRQLMARYPDYDANIRPYGGFAEDAFSRARAARWNAPAGAFIHAMHRAHWGGYHYRITGKDENGEVQYEGGWQNNRQMGMHPQHRYVENVFEELDAPGEWFHDGNTHTLYCKPEPGVDLARAVMEAVRLRHLIELRGSRDNPVRNVTLRGFVFRHAARTFMDVKEPLLRSDWTIYRGGAVLFQGTEDCTVADCEFDQLGGNAVFVSRYNRHVTVRGCDFHDTGASAIAFVGDPQSVRNPLFEYGQRQSYAAIDQTPGPRSDDYPAGCRVEDCLIRRVGVVEKQATGVEISMAMGITIRHCSIYEASRAGINISEGTFGGHLIEFCDVFDTVRETGDHGSFNSWGRDRFWGLTDVPSAELPRLALLDAVQPTVIRNNRWRCDHGWDVDLDDGSSHYEISHNLFLHGGLKLREGFHRKVWNNIAVNNTLHPHVWYENSGDVVTRNIWMGAYRPAVMKIVQWGQEIDRNLFTTSEADRTRFAPNGCDANSLVGDPLFVDAAKGDYRVKDGSPALKLGFENFPMDQFGVQSARLKAIARTPELPSPADAAPAVAGKPPLQHHWQGAIARNLEGEEFSAFGVSRESGGVHLVEVPSGSLAARNGLLTGDLIQSIEGEPVKTIAGLMWPPVDSTRKSLKVGIIRGQQPRELTLDSFVLVSAGDAFSPSPGDSPIRRIRALPETSNDPLATLHDQQLAQSYGPVFRNGIRGGMYRADLGSVRQVLSVTTWSHNQNGNRGAQNFALFGSAAEDPGWHPGDRSRFTPIAEVDTRGRPQANHPGTTIRNSQGQPLGSFRWLVWVVQPVTEGLENTAFQEFQVTADE